MTEENYTPHDDYIGSFICYDKILPSYFDGQIIMEGDRLYVQRIDAETSGERKYPCTVFPKWFSFFRYLGTCQFPLTIHFSRATDLKNYLITDVEAVGLEKLLSERPIESLKFPPKIRKQFFQETIQRIRALSEDYDGHQDQPNYSKTIPKEIGELEMLNAAIGFTLPPALQTWVRSQLETLRRDIIKDSTEKSHIRRALSFTLSTDWNPVLPPPPSDEEVKEYLDRTLYGLTPVKKRIREIFSQMRSANTLPAYGILLCGPAGVGKTMIAAAVADLLGLPTVRLELSAITSSASVTGTPMIYGNARPGLILESMWNHFSAATAVIINELDKTGKDVEGGDISISMLSLLDGSGFVDNYLGVPIPTNKCFFIATTNDTSKINDPMLSRFVVVNIPTYSIEEKKTIFRHYALPKALSAATLSRSAVNLTDDAVDLIVRDYITESGAREGEKIAESIVLDYLLKTEQEATRPDIIYGRDSIRELLGPGNRIRREFALEPGLSHGIYVTEDTALSFIIQAITIPGKGEIEVLGALTESQVESIKVAYYAVRSKLPGELSNKNVIVNVLDPIPPSKKNFLGLPSYMAIASAIDGTTIDSQALFVGGIDLRGNIFYDSNTVEPLLASACLQECKCIYGAVAMKELIVPTENTVDLQVVTALKADGIYLMANSVYPGQ